MTKPKGSTGCSRDATAAGCAAGTYKPSAVTTLVRGMVRGGPWALVCGVLVFGGVTCSGRGTTEADGRSMWEFSGKVSAGAELRGAEHGGASPQASAEQ